MAKTPDPLGALKRTHGVDPASEARQNVVHAGPRPVPIECVDCRELSRPTRIGTGWFHYDSHDREFDVHQRCSSCASARKKAEQAAEIEREAIEKAAKQKAQFEQEVPARFKDATWDTLHPVLQEKLLSWLEDPQQAMLLLWSPTPGNGKTWAGYALGRLYNQRTPTTAAMAWTVPDLVDALRQEMDPASKGTPVLARGLRDWPGLLLLDDLGAEKMTEFSAQELYRIIDCRDRELRRTVVTSNLTPDEIGKALGKRMASRLTGDTSLRFDRKDRRARRKDTMK